MSVKQDRTGVRTAVDLERKYNFGKTFAEMLGLINDSRDKVDSVKSELRNEITEQATSIRRDTEGIVASATQTIKSEVNGEIEKVANKVAELELTADGLEVRVEEAITKASSAESTASNAASDAGSAINKYSSLVVDVNNFKAEVGKRVDDLESKVELGVDSDALTIAIEKRLESGVDSVVTKTGYRFDSDGMTIAKSGNAMSNRIDNTGMYVTRSGREVLTANKDGVNAMNLHAKTYLIIGSGNGRSRFEDYGSNRTGCFWIG